VLPYSIKAVPASGLISDAVLVATFAFGEAAMVYAASRRGMTFIHYNDEPLFVYVDGYQISTGAEG
jgi:hypothetical protein